MPGSFSTSAPKLDERADEALIRPSDLLESLGRCPFLHDGATPFLLSP
jgi:hypothetical protein